MHPNGIYNRLAAEAKESEARLNARLDRIEAKLDAIMQLAGLDPAAFAPISDAVESSARRSPLPSIGPAVERNDLTEKAPATLEPSEA